MSRKIGGGRTESKQSEMPQVALSCMCVYLTHIYFPASYTDSAYAQ